MEQNNLIKAAGLFLAAFGLIGFIVWRVSTSGDLEADLFKQLDEMAELDMELCPFDGELTRTSRAILFDFSDPLPAQLSGYPNQLLENMMTELADADRFDRFSLYALNPYSNTPKNLNAFCVPVTLNQIPKDIRQTLWGKDPAQHSTLPDRYQRFAEVFERLWENESELNNSMQETMSALTRQARGEQGFSRIIENIEEIAHAENDRQSGVIEITILSNLLQNSPQYSHYRGSWDFENYFSARPDGPVDMSNIEFDIYFVQSCESLESAKRRALRRFWEDYFEFSQASKVRFKVLRIDGDECVDRNAIPTQVVETRIQPELPDGGSSQAKSSAQGGEATAPTNALDDLNPGILTESQEEGPAGIVDNSPAKATRKPPDTNEPDTPGLAANETVPHTKLGRGTEKAEAGQEGGNELVLQKDHCAQPKQRNRPVLVYPKRARGRAKLHYRVELDLQGTPVSFALQEIDVGQTRSEKYFKSEAEKYIKRLRFDVYADENCTGGQTARVGLVFDH